MVDEKILQIMRQQQHDMNDGKIQTHPNDYDVQVFSELPYLPDGETNPDHRLDVYSPKGAKEMLPTVVLIHGGGYASGYKELDRQMGQYIAAKGFHVVNMNYTLMPEVGFETELQEAFSVFRWIDENQEMYGFDVHKVSVMGDSSGGHYVLLIAAVQQNPELQAYFHVKPYVYGLKGIVSICPSGFESAMYGTGEIFGNIRKVLGKWFQDETYVKNCFYQNFMKENYPKIMLVTTPTDSILASYHKELHAYMEQKGITHVFRSYEGTVHALDHVFNVLFPEYEESIQANDDIVAYLKEMSA